MPSITLKWEGNDITSHVLNYTRSQKVCDGVGEIVVEVKYSSNSYTTYDQLELWENGNKVGKYNIRAITKERQGNLIRLDAQDNSKRLQDYWVTDVEETWTLTYTKTKIIKYLVEAGVNYIFTATGSGTPLTNGTTLGNDSAYNIILGLLQQSGWYLYFNENGKAIVGDFDDVGKPKESLDDTDILSLHFTEDDKMYRNRTLVIGGTDPYTGSWVKTDISTNNGPKIDSNDIRTVVIGNSNIRVQSDSDTLAQTVLDEFDSATQVKIIRLDGYHNLVLGSAVKISGNFAWNGVGLVTGLSVSYSPDGFITTLQVDERCPRLFGYFGLPLFDNQRYVIIGGNQLLGSDPNFSGVFYSTDFFDVAEPVWIDITANLPSDMFYGGAPVMRYVNNLAGKVSLWLLDNYHGDDGINGTGYHSQIWYLDDIFAISPTWVLKYDYYHDDQGLPRNYTGIIKTFSVKSDNLTIYGLKVQKCIGSCSTTTYNAYIVKSTDGLATAFSTAQTISSSNWGVIANETTNYFHSSFSDDELTCVMTAMTVYDPTYPACRHIYTDDDFLTYTHTLDQNTNSNGFFQEVAFGRGNYEIWLVKPDKEASPDAHWIYKSTTGGSDGFGTYQGKWQEDPTSLQPHQYSSVDNSVGVYQGGDWVMICTTYPGDPILTRDGNGTWAWKASPHPGDGPTQYYLREGMYVYCVVPASIIDPNYWIIGGRDFLDPPEQLTGVQGRIFLTTDFGDTWLLKDGVGLSLDVEQGIVTTVMLVDVTKAI